VYVACLFGLAFFYFIKKMRTSQATSNKKHIANAVKNCTIQPQNLWLLLCVFATPFL